MKQDPVVAGVRAVRRNILKACGNDRKRYASRLRKIGAGVADRRVYRVPSGSDHSRVAEGGAEYGRRDEG